MEPTDYTENLEQTQESAERPRQLGQGELAPAEAMIHQLQAVMQDIPEGDLAWQIAETGIKLLRDQTNRGDVKLITKAVKELRYALKVFTPYRAVRKVSIFGSARTAVTHPDYRQAEMFARTMAGKGWMVITGAGGGIMAAGHGGAGPDPSFGLAIRLPFEQRTNATIAADKKLINFKYFFTRKLMFVRAANAIALFPGGFGTMDEGFEVLTLIQTGKCIPMPVVLVDCPGGTYWKNWSQFVERELLGRDLISKEDLVLYTITDDLDRAVHEVTHFYANFHSIRYHRDDLIIRLQHRATAAQVAAIERDFSDIKVTGAFHATAALPIESDEPDLAELHRLVFAFNRRDQGRLRMLINRLNDMAE